jgi:DNA-binding NtrC family response regulator
LNVIRIELPPLRERRDDIPLLVDHFCRRFNATFKKEIMGMAPETMDILTHYRWPGNVRELENCIERAFIVCHDSVILPKHLPPEVLNNRTAGPQIPNAGDGTRLDTDSKNRIIEVLERTDWNIAKSARMLGIARNTLYQRMKALDIVRRPE